jgi:hypothetical protein
MSRIALYARKRAVAVTMKDMILFGRATDKVLSSQILHEELCVRFAQQARRVKTLSAMAASSQGLDDLELMYESGFERFRSLQVSSLDDVSAFNRELGSTRDRQVKMLETLFDSVIDEAPITKGSPLKAHLDDIVVAWLGITTMVGHQLAIHQTAGGADDPEGGRVGMISQDEPLLDIIQSCIEEGSTLADRYMGGLGEVPDVEVTGNLAARLVSARTLVLAAARAPPSFHFHNLTPQPLSTTSLLQCNLHPRSLTVCGAGGVEE